MILRKFKTFFKTNKLKLLIILLHRSFLSYYIKKILKLQHSDLVTKRAKMSEGLTLSNLEEMTLVNFQKNGFVDVTSFFSTEDMSSLEKKTFELDKKISEISNITYHKKFWSRMTDADNDAGNVTNIINRIALNNSILKVLYHYFSAPAFMDYSIVTKSVYSGEKYQISQLWHQDKDDYEMAKLFIYINDVTDRNGPFTLLNKQSSKKIPTSFLRNHIEDDFIFKRVKQGEVIYLTGKKYTAFLVDTSKCFHMGSRITSQGQFRYMLTATFITLPSIYPWQTCNKYYDTENLTPLAMLATRDIPD